MVLASKEWRDLEKKYTHQILTSRFICEHQQLARIQEPILRRWLNQLFEVFDLF